MNLSKIAVRRPVTTTMVLFIIIAFGILSITNLNMDLMPNMNIPIAIVSTGYSGVGPEEIEKLITEPLEGVLGTVPGIDTISSISSYGSSIVVLQFDDNVDIDIAALDMRERVDMIKDYLPDGADAPMVLKIDMNSMVSFSVGFSSEKYDLVELTRLVNDRILDRIKRQPGVAQVSVSGGREKEISVVLNEDRLRGYGINENQIAQLLAAENRTTPTGSIKQGDKRLQLRVSGEFTSLDDIRNLTIASPTGGQVFLSDIAVISEVYKEMSAESYINGIPSVTVSVQKQSTANTVNVSEAVVSELNRISEDMPDLQARVITDPAEFIRRTLSTVVSSAVSGGILAVIILYVFLREYRSTLIVAVAMPVSIISTFVLMYYANINLNMMSLGGLALGIGMLVDNSIVVIESVFRKLEDGIDRYTSAIDGAKEVAMAVTASTLTTLVVFLPITFVGGLIGSVFNELALTIAFSLISSLLVSITFVPMACSLLIKPENVTRQRHKLIIFAPLDFIGYLIRKLEDGYRIALSVAIRFRKTTVLINLIFVALTSMTISRVPAEFIPAMDENGVDISLSMPRGTLLSETYKTAEILVDRIKDAPEIVDVSLNIGGGSDFGDSSSDSASITVSLVDKNERTRSADEIARDFAKLTSDIPGAEITADPSSSAMGGGTFAGGEVTINIKGSDLELLNEISEDMKEKVESVPGTRDVSTSISQTAPQATIAVNRMKAAAYGVNASSVASVINTAISGTVATTYKIDGDEYDIRITRDQNNLDFIMDVQNILIPSSSGVNIPLYELANITVDNMPVSITREDQSRYVSVSARLDGRTAGEVSADIEALFSDYPMPQNYTWELSGSAQRMNEAFGNLGLSLIISLFLVYMIMAAQFESLSYPFIVMFSIPIALTGGLFGVFLLGDTLSITSYLGLIMLAGIVVNNAIVLIDYINLLTRERGMPVIDAIKTAGPVRLRPILMTTLTTVLGLTPMMLTNQQGSEMMRGLSTVVVFGLSLSTLVTLFFVPVVYLMLNNLKMWITSLFKRSKQLG